MYLHAIANSKNRLAKSEYCWIKPGSIFCIHRIGSSRDDNSSADLRMRVSEESLTANHYTKSIPFLPFSTEEDSIQIQRFCSNFGRLEQIQILSQLINILLQNLVVFILLQCVEVYQFNSHLLTSRNFKYINTNVSICGKHEFVFIVFLINGGNK